MRHLLLINPVKLSRAFDFELCAGPNNANESRSIRHHERTFAGGGVSISQETLK